MGTHSFVAIPHLTLTPKNRVRVALFMSLPVVAHCESVIAKIDFLGDTPPLASFDLRKLLECKIAAMNSLLVLEL